MNMAQCTGNAERGVALASAGEAASKHVVRLVETLSVLFHAAAALTVG
jgi:hypothetical protein